MTDPKSTSARWAALRDCWLDLQNPELYRSAETEFYQDLQKRHSAAIAALTADENLGADTEDRLRLAFEQATGHLWRSRSRMASTCYAVIPAAFEPRENLLTQAAALADMAQHSDIEVTTVAKAQDALARDIAWLALFEAGGKPWQQETIEVSPTETEAARILADMLTGKM